jgi:beta-lactamase superfamily II metal-dependent hydrolase
MDFGNSAPVILTHWDMDHYAMALKEPAARRRAWLVPEQKVGPSAMHIVSQVDSLYVWYSSYQRRSPVTCSAGRLAVHRPSGRGSRNNSGLLISVWLDCGEVLVTGDMSYKVTGTSVLGRGADALIAAHHGSARGIGTPPLSVDGLVIYSYGLANSYGHPSNASLISHFEEGWERRLDTTMGDILISGCCPYGCRRCRCHRLDGTVLNTP